MPTNYKTIVADSPTFAAEGAKGARDTKVLNSIFPIAVVSTESTKDGTALGNTAADGSSAKINFKDGESYKNWYYANVVNGVINNGGWMKNGTTSQFNMNYTGYDAIHSPPDLSKNSPLKDSNGVEVATNSFVPFVATLDLSKQDAGEGKPIPFVDGASNDEFAKTIQLKTPTAPGVGGSAGTDSRNPSKTSKNQASPVMTLGKYLKA